MPKKFFARGLSFSIMEVASINIPAVSFRPFLFFVSFQPEFVFVMI